MQTKTANKSINFGKKVERKQIKRLLDRISLVPDNDVDSQIFTTRKRPSYLKYIEYV